MTGKLIIDGHVHCGPRTIQGMGSFGARERRNELSNPIERLKRGLQHVDVRGAVIIPFPEDIYRAPFATAGSRKIAHEYILDIAENNEYLYPFYFVWNDFVIPDHLSQFKGVKWHRHFWSEPEYDYADPRCDEFVEALRKYDLPIIFEESFENTKLFCNNHSDLKVIVPHLGSLNGGVNRILTELKNYPNVHVDTSNALPFDIVTAIVQFGANRVVFGSDTPYSSTKIELLKILEYDLIKQFCDEDVNKILGENILKLMHITV